MKGFGLENKVYLVTGASSGIGRETAVSLSEEGAKVILLARNEEELSRTYDMLEGSGHMVCPFDLEKEDKYDSLMGKIVERYGPLDGFIYSAGVSAVMPVRIITKEQAARVMNINFLSFVEMVRVFSKNKNHNADSAIVGISSIVTERGEKCQTVYAASKAAMEAAVRCLSIELYEKGIRINAVAPGMIRTEMMQKVIEKGSDPSVLGASSLMGIGEPSDVADSVLFLLSRRSRHITGRILPVDGGTFL
ncbi:MAG: SDR family oxidoreductase [Eubacterium sp.]|nr:SDR family oxidoreductase [Eubacterium sp.]